MRSFDSLIKDLDGEEKENQRIIIKFDLNKYLEALEDEQKLLNFGIFLYLCLNNPLDEKIPLIEQIAKDFKLEVREVKEAITDLSDYGFLELPEADWRKRQIELIEKESKRYLEEASAFLFNLKGRHTKGKNYPLYNLLLSKVETDFMITADMVHKTYEEALAQGVLAINLGDREAMKQALYFIKLLADWFNKARTSNSIEDGYKKIKDIITTPKLIYSQTKKDNIWEKKI